MSAEPSNPKGWSRKQIVLLVLSVFLVGASFLLYANFNRLLGSALRNTFESHVISDVYELRFKNLRVNLLEGSIRVNDVVLQPRETPLREYPYINSSFTLKTDELRLEKVEILALLRANRLNLERILIKRPEIEVMITGRRSIFFPFSDSTATTTDPEPGAKKTIGHFLLKSFELVDASFHSLNTQKKREFSVKGLRIALNNLMISQRAGEDILGLERGELAIAEFDGKLARGGGRHMQFRDLLIGVDSLDLMNSIDTVMYRARDAQTSVRDVDVQTVDSLYHLTLKSYAFSARNKSLDLKGIVVSPNRTFEEMQKKYKYSQTSLSASVGSLAIRGLNVDSLLYARKLFVDQIDLDSVNLTLYADLTKPNNPDKRPLFLGQAVASIPLPLSVKKVVAKRVHLINQERKLNGEKAEVHITQGKAQLENVTNQSKTRPLVLSADALLAGRTHFKATLAFDYNKTEYKFNGVLGKFDLPNMNPILQAYTPASITKGVADEISFSGVAGDKESTGKMTFRYHDLEVDIDLKDKAKWKSSVLTFTANTAVHASNPPSEGMPPRVVTFRVARDNQKGFINLLIKSLLDGIKETMFMSKENRKAYKEAKRKAKN